MNGGGDTIMALYVLIGLVGTLVLLWRGCFAFPVGPEHGHFGVVSTVLAFVLFMAAAFGAPIAIGLIGPSAGRQTALIAEVASIGVALLLLLSLVHVLPNEMKRRIWGEQLGWGKRLRAMLRGVGITLLVYPVVMVIVELVSRLTQWIVPFQQQEQLAMQSLQAAMAAPWLFALLSIGVVVAVPVTEELLFRGFILNTFARAGRHIAVVVTSLLFALCHCTVGMGLSNVGICTGLFCFAYTMGARYIKEHTLWTNIAMHGTFNGLSTLLLLLK